MSKRRVPIALLFWRRASRSQGTPSPLFRPGDERRRTDRLDLSRVVEHFVSDLVHGRARRVDVAMRLVPEARLVVEDVIADPAGRARAPAGAQMLNPPL